MDFEHGYVALDDDREEGELTVSCNLVEGDVQRLGSILASNEGGIHCRVYRNNVQGGHLDVAGQRVGDGPHFQCRCNAEV